MTNWRKGKYRVKNKSESTSYKYIYNGRIDKAKEVVAVKTERTIGDGDWE